MNSLTQNPITIFILKLFRKIGLLKFVTIPLNLNIAGRKFRVPVNKEIGFNNHQMDEMWMLDLFKKLHLHDNAYLLDLGANVGQTLLKWKAVYHQGIYHGVEPLPICTNYLRHLIRINNFTNCEITDKAVSNEDAQQSLFLHFDDATDRSASLTETIFESKSSFLVETVSLATLLELMCLHPQNLDILKMDIEGSEKEILLHQLEVIKKYRPIIIVEFLESAWDLKSWNEVIENYTQNQYNINQILKDQNRLSGIQEIKNYPFPNADKFIDLIFIPGERLSNYNL